KKSSVSSPKTASHCTEVWRETQIDPDKGAKPVGHIANFFGRLALWGRSRRSSAQRSCAQKKVTLPTLPTFSTLHALRPAASGFQERKDQRFCKPFPEEHGAGSFRCFAGHPLPVQRITRGATNCNNLQRFAKRRAPPCLVRSSSSHIFC